MDKFNKRKFEREENDDWEKATTNIKREAPNRAAMYSSLLELQNENLKQTYINLEAISESLKSSLATIDCTNLQLQNILTTALLECDIALLKAKNEIVQLFTKKQNDSNGYLYRNKDNMFFLLKQIQYLLDQFKPHLLMNGNIPLITENLYNDRSERRLQYNLEVDKLVNSHNELEKRYINAKLAIHGNREYGNTIENYIKKMNGLPQIIPILNSSTRSNEDNSKQLQQEKSTLTSVIKLIIDELSYLRIKFPLMASQQRIKHQLLQDHLNFLECIYNSLMRQMSYQQLLLDSFENERKLCMNYKSNLQIYINNFERGEEKSTLLQPLKKKDNDSYKNNVDTAILRLKKYLTSSDMIKVTQSMVNYEGKWKKQWSNDIHATLEAVRVLDQSKSILSKSLYHESITLTDQLNIKPKPYNALQSTIERRIQDFTDISDSLTLEYNKTESLYKERYQLTNLFFTNPFIFETEVEDYLDIIANTKSKLNKKPF